MSGELQEPIPPRLPQVGSVDVWVCDSAALSEADVEYLARLLPAAQRAAADRFHDESLRKRHLVSNAMRLAVLGIYIDAPPEAIAIGRGRHGKPYVMSPAAGKYIFFNASHTAAITAMAVCRSGEIGIDIERIRPDMDIDEVASLCLTERERTALARLPQSEQVRAFFTCWTRKEALLKAQGTGLRPRPAQVEAGLGLYDRMAGDESSGAHEGWSLGALDIGAGYVGALAIAGPLTRLNVQRWQPVTGFVLPA